MMQAPDPGLGFADRGIGPGQHAGSFGAELGAGEGALDAEELRLLVADGLAKGFLTYDEIAAGLQDVELNPEQIEDFYTYLVECSIELVAGEQHKHPSHERPVLPDDAKEPPKLDLTVEPSSRPAGIGAKRTRPYRSRRTARVERFIRTLLERWAYAYPCAQERARAAALAPPPSTHAIASAETAPRRRKADKVHGSTGARGTADGDDRRLRSPPEACRVGVLQVRTRRSGLAWRSPPRERPLHSIPCRRARSLPRRGVIARAAAGGTTRGSSGRACSRPGG